jgi:hypothetical protein
MAYLRHIALTRGPAAPATIAVVARGVPDSETASVRAELRDLFPHAADGEARSSQLVVLVGPSTTMESRTREIGPLAIGATIWCYSVDLGRVVVISGRSLGSWQRQQEWTARVESWARRHRARWTVLGDLGRLVDRTLRSKSWSGILRTFPLIGTASTRAGQTPGELDTAIANLPRP